MTYKPENAAVSYGASSAGDFIDPPEMSAPTGSPGGNLMPPGVTTEAFQADPQAVQTILEAKAKIEQMLRQAAGAKAFSMAMATNSFGPGVHGVGVGSHIPGKTSLVVYVESDHGEDRVRRELVDTMSIQAVSNDNFPMEVVVTGRIKAYSSNQSKFRPTPAGASVGHFKITAGTIGGWAKGNGIRSNRLLLVSNNHVLANSNNALFNDNILQPGPVDGGQNPADRIAILERFVPITFGNATNFVDCATAWCWTNMVRTERDHVYHGAGSTPKFFKVGSSVVSPAIDMLVGKAGRTTDLTQGRIQATGVAVNVDYDGQVGHFQDQFSVTSTGNSDFSAGGDSGSFVWKWESGLPVTGLLFAGGRGVTFCNPMERVVAALDITLL